MVKRSIEQNLRIKNFEAQNGNFEKNAVYKEFLEIVGIGNPTGSV